MAPISTHIGSGTNDTDRGQLLLIAGLTMAIIILGLVVAFNGVLYSQTTAAGAAGEEMDDVEMMEHELEEYVIKFVESIPEGERVMWNCRGGGGGSYCVPEEMGDDLDSFESHYSKSKSEQKAVSISVDSTFENDGNDLDFIEIEYDYRSNEVYIENGIIRFEEDDLDHLVDGQS